MMSEVRAAHARHVVGSGGVRPNLATEAVAKRFLGDFQFVVRL
jgi:hypothetical protein